MILVDSSVWIDYFNGSDTRETDLLDARLGAGALITGDLVMTEVLQGFRHERHYRQALATLEILPFEPMVGPEVAMASAWNFRLLRSRGVTARKTIDMLIATFCVLRGHDLLHSDRDFDAIAEPLGLVTL